MDDYCVVCVVCVRVAARASLGGARLAQQRWRGVLPACVTCFFFFLEVSQLPVWPQLADAESAAPTRSTIPVQRHLA